MNEKLKVLIVDDEPDARTTLSDILQLKGYDTFEAKDGAECMRIVNDEFFNIMLLDLNLPDMSGLAVLENVKSVNALVEIIVLSGLSTIENAIEATNKGAFSYIKKPYDADQLILQMTRAIEKQRTQERINKLTTAIEQSASEVVITDKNGCIEYVNPKFTELTGYTYDEAIGNNPNMLKSSKTPTNTHKELWSSIIAGRSWHGEFYNKKKDGSIFCEAALVSPVKNSENAITHFIKEANDITLKKESENELVRMKNHLESIFRSVKDAIITVDKDLTVIELNESAESLCGFTRKELIGQPFNKHVVGCHGQCYKTLQDAIDKDNPITLEHIACDGINHAERHIVNLNSVPLRDHNNVSYGAVIVIKDETRLSELERVLHERSKFHNIIGKNKKMQELYGLIEDLAEVHTTVLITGESGTGKELIADALHYQGDRRDKPIVKINCSALPDELLESELFGHIKGAFTGAINDRTGRFSKADGGTIFLDEIGDISNKMQLRLLRALQEKTFEKVGDSTPIKVDVRIIAATNQQLREKVKNGEFREDLFYRLKVVELNLPPLRERMDDVPLLTNHFIGVFNKTFKKNIKSLSDDAKKIFMDYSWPGNIRELQHTLEHAFVICRKPVIDVDVLPVDLKNINKNRDAYIEEKDNGDERGAILRALEKSGWNKTKAAKLLGVDRRTVYLKIKKYNISEDS